MSKNVEKYSSETLLFSKIMVFPVIRYISVCRRPLHNQNTLGVTIDYNHSFCWAMLMSSSCAIVCQFSYSSLFQLHHFLGDIFGLVCVSWGI